ncbi:hypothetical protein DBV15_12369 [Temnothorax longispinosus]|uniref:F-box/LRR-repeat protein 4 n=1 Tax=Temnothorax longispinosus TaxID=300112 RepID=A0A4S2KTR5_9HYME|nr:hypothetical protein DBV15_12369 [Temnothorax longispinosus]
MENMASYHSINKVVAGEDRVNFIYQYVKYSNDRVKEYNYKNTPSIMETSERIIRPPTNFPNYGDFLSTFVMRTKGFDISTSPWQKPLTDSYGTPQDNSHMYCNYLDIEFHEAVYPFRVSIYEVYNPGYVTNIWARDEQWYLNDITLIKKKQRKNQWFLLWSGPPQNAVPLTSRIFSPPLKFCDFKIKELRLQFLYSHWDYSTHLDAVELIGTSELVDKIVLIILKNLDIRSLCRLSQITVLDLSCCHLSICHRPKYKPLDFSCLENLEFLEDLNLRYMYIATATLCKILQKNRRMRNLNLSTLDGGNFNSSFENQDAVAIQLGNSVITSRGIEALAECKNLRELNISYTYVCVTFSFKYIIIFFIKICTLTSLANIMKHYCYSDYGTNYFRGTYQLSLRRLFSSCQLLEEVNLLGLRGNFDEPLTLCKNLKQIYLEVPTENADSFTIFEQCPKLQTIYIQYSYETSGHFVAQAKEKYPHLSIYEYSWGTLF